ncbi:hypothetical protein PMIN06_009281 [Paraphaeosphaeria minitans]|uniref:Uncharacterized protein n=1 Tax=Paraphaeosphaeria minitans TaxID=565426 RepID=A0A9P6KL05_9PLEO|nr:hypothetical protein PMIN01_11715 [Paraphaeosphaeria minitans]KAF9730151.1 hypothetical protein PMIN01_12084 [Paraphaeosphaeria minitans]
MFIALRFARLIAELDEKDPGKVWIVFAGLQLIYQAAKAQSSVRQRLTNDHSARPVHEPTLHEISKGKLARITLQAPAIVLDPFTIFNQHDLSVLTENIGKLLPVTKRAYLSATPEAKMQHASSTASTYRQ